MSPTAELRWVDRFEPYPACKQYEVLQQKWVAHHIPAGKTEADFEWRDVETVKETK